MRGAQLLAGAHPKKKISGCVVRRVPPFSLRAMGRPQAARLVLVRRLVVALFCCALLLPLFVSFSRGEPAGLQLTDDDNTLLAAAPAAAVAKQRAAAKAQSRRRELLPVGSPVLVFLARETGATIEVHTTKSDAGLDVCRGAAEEGETAPEAAARVLRACSGLGPPPETELLEQLGVATPACSASAACVASVALAATLPSSLPAAFVAFARSEKLRGTNQARFQAPSPACF